MIQACRVAAVLALLGLGAVDAGAAASAPKAGQSKAAGHLPAGKARTAPVAKPRGSVALPRNASPGVTAKSGKPTRTPTPARKSAVPSGTQHSSAVSSQARTLGAARRPGSPVLGGPATYDPKRGAAIGGPGSKPRR